MTQAPKRIWFNAWDRLPRMADDGSSTEYIRADLVPQSQPIETAPKGEVKTVIRKICKNEVEVQEHIPVWIIAAGSGQVVTFSRWLPDQGRWNMFSKDCQPIAWQPWPQHPEAM